MRFPLLHLIAVAIIVVLLFGVGKAWAAEPPPPGQPNTDQFDCCARFNTESAKLRVTGVWYWTFKQNNSCPSGMYNDVRAAMAEISFQLGFVTIESNSGNIIYANCGPAFAAICGSSTGIAGCLGHSFPVNVQIDLNTVIMDYYPLSKLSIILHENMHAMATWNEQYQLGTLAPSPGWYDFMNTGELSRHSFDYNEDGRWDRTMGVDPQASGWGQNDLGYYLYWCNTDTSAQRVALLRLNRYTGQYVFTGAYAPVAAGACTGWHLFNWDGLTPDWLPCVNIENGVNTVVGRNDTCIPVG